MTKYIIIAVACAAVALLDTVKKTGSLKGWFSSSILGLGGLYVLDMMPVFGAIVSTNLFSVAVAAAFGIPGLLGLLIMQMLCYT